MSIEFYEDLKTHLANVQSPGKSIYFSFKAPILTFYGVKSKKLEKELRLRYAACVTRETL